MDNISVTCPRKGQWPIVLLLLAVGGVMLFFGYQFYIERYYICLFDGNMTRYLDIPPYGSRVTPAYDELRGYAEIALRTMPDQVSHFLGQIALKRGFIIRQPNSSSIEIEIHPQYVVKGIFKDNKLIFTWNPLLDEAKKQKKAQLEAEGKLPPTSAASSAVGVK